MGTISTNHRQDTAPGPFNNIEINANFISLGLSGTIISATTLIPYVVGISEDSKFKVVPSPISSPVGNVLDAVSTSTWKHTLVGWTGAVLRTPSNGFIDSLPPHDLSKQQAVKNTLLGNSSVPNLESSDSSDAFVRQFEDEEVKRQGITITKEKRRELETLLEHASKNKVVPVWIGDWADEVRDALTLQDQDRWLTNEDQIDAGIQDKTSNKEVTSQQSFENCRRFNHSVADAIIKVYQPGDIIWVHGDQLMLLPAILRHKIPSAYIIYSHHANWTIPTEQSLYERLTISTKHILHSSLVCMVDHCSQDAFLSFCRDNLNMQVSTDGRIHGDCTKTHVLDATSYGNICIPPNALEKTQVMKIALETDQTSEIQQHDDLMHNVRNRNFQTSLQVFLANACSLFSDSHPTKTLPQLKDQQLLQQYTSTRKRLLMFDYDGTLTPIVNDPDAALPTKTLLMSLESLSANSRNRVWVISGRSRVFLEKLFGHINGLGLSAEHGSFIRNPGEIKWQNLAASTDMEWKDKTAEVFNELTSQYAASWIERKEVAMVWHYRNAIDHDACLTKAVEIKAYLQGEKLKDWDVEVMLGKANLEVRPRFLNKGVTASKLIHEAFGEDDRGFVLCAGDDVTDEDMFRAMLSSNLESDGLFSCLVSKGPKPSLAHYRMSEPGELVDILEMLSLEQN